MAKRPRYQTRHGRHREPNRLLRRTTYQDDNDQNSAEGFVVEQAARLSVTETELFDVMQLVQDEDEFFTFEQVLAATTASDIGLAPPFSPQLESVDFNGSTEFLANLTNNPLGIANAWTVSTVFKLDTFAVNQTIFQIPSTTSGNNFSNISIIASGTLGLLVILTDATGTPTSANLKSWRWNNVVASATWVNAVVKWDGADIFLVINGVDQGVPDTKSDDDAITMADTSRKIFIWADRGSGSSDAGNFLYAAIWDKVLTDAELLEAWNSGVAGSFNLGADSGDYASSANLQHWWRPCADDTDIGKDSGIASTLIDVLTDAVGITAADCVADVPA